MKTGSDLIRRIFSLPRKFRATEESSGLRPAGTPRRGGYRKFGGGNRGPVGQSRLFRREIQGNLFFPNPNFYLRAHRRIGWVGRHWTGDGRQRPSFTPSQLIEKIDDGRRWTTWTVPFYIRGKKYHRQGAPTPLVRVEWNGLLRGGLEFQRCEAKTGIKIPRRRTNSTSADRSPRAIDGRDFDPFGYLLVTQGQIAQPQASPPSHDIQMKSMGWIGAGDGNRTHDIQLGKLTFYL